MGRSEVGFSEGNARTGWIWEPWRLLPPLFVLFTVFLIWATRPDTLSANQWAYPMTLVVVGLVALLLVVRSRPRWVAAGALEEEPGSVA